MNEKCRGMFGRLRCNFEPRYSATGPTEGQIRAVQSLGILMDSMQVAGIASARTTTYVCDVCTACGEVTDAQSSESK